MNKQKINKRQTPAPLPFIVRDSAEVQLDVGFYARGQLLAWEAQRWHDSAAVGTSLPGRGYGPAALSLVLGCSRRQGHMPEGELATLLPIPPGALLNPPSCSFTFSSLSLHFLPCSPHTLPHPFTTPLTHCPSFYIFLPSLSFSSVPISPRFTPSSLQMTFSSSSLSGFPVSYRPPHPHCLRLSLPFPLCM